MANYRAAAGVGPFSPVSGALSESIGQEPASLVSQRSPGALAASQLDASDRRQLSVRFAASAGEVRPSELGSASWHSGAASNSQEMSTSLGGAHRSQLQPLMEEVYRESRNIRQQLDSKRADVVAALQAQQQTEQMLRQVLAERQSLHGEVRLLQHRISELERAATEEQNRRSELQKRCDEAERCRRDAELAQRDAEKRCREVEGKVKDLEKKEAQLESRVQAAEMESAASAQRARDAEERCRLQTEVNVSESKLKCAELGAARQQELQAALLEIQALAQGQELLRSELRRAMRPLPLWPLGPDPAATLRPLQSQLPMSAASGSKPRVEEAIERLKTSSDLLRQGRPMEPARGLGLSLGLTAPRAGW